MTTQIARLTAHKDLGALLSLTFFSFPNSSVTAHHNVAHAHDFDHPNPLPKLHILSPTSNYILNTSIRDATNGYLTPGYQVTSFAIQSMLQVGIWHSSKSKSPDYMDFFSPEENIAEGQTKVLFVLEQKFFFLESTIYYGKFRKG